MAGPRTLFDGLISMISGLGTTADPRRQNSYAWCPVTRPEIEAAYRASGMMRKVVNVPALDMIREGRDWQADKQQIEAIEKEEKRLGLMRHLYAAEIMRGLGGGAIILGLPGDPMQPAPANVGKGGLAYLRVVSRDHLSLGPEVTDPRDPNFGEPSWFQMSVTGGVQHLHPSRVVPFKGAPIPRIRATRSWDDEYWGESRVEQVLEAVKDSDTAHQSFAALIKKAQRTRMGIPKLLDITATQAGEDMLSKRIAAVAMAESQFNWTLYDAGDGDGKGGETITDHAISWSGVDSIMSAFDIRVAAVADIPVTRLLGRSPGGMNATGDSDMQNWDRMVRARQELDLRPCMERIDAYLVPSALGSAPAGIWWKFAPLFVPTEKEEADRFKTTADALKSVQDMGIVPDQAFAKAGQNTLVEGGWIAGLDTALEEIPEDERYGLAPGMDPMLADPSALQNTSIVNGGKEADLTSPTTRGAGGRSVPARADNNSGGMTGGA